jgi:peptidoglycan-associated lipoprotein
MPGSGSRSTSGDLPGAEASAPQRNPEQEGSMTQTFRFPRWAALAAAAAAAVSLGCASTATREMAPSPATEMRDPGPVTLRQASGPSLAPVYFDTDLALLREDARRALEGHAKSILAHPDWGKLTIEGHCDERGSDEYNLALGGRRASAVKRYLMDLGVPAERLDTRTFGEERPAVAGHDENAWRYNRRSELAGSGQESASR